MKLDKKLVKSFQPTFTRFRNEISKVVVGQDEVINGLLRGILSNGHVLLEGVPGIAKTLIARSSAIVTSCTFKRIQFTADLLPADILGLTIYTKGTGFNIVKGPLFANFVLADEINRAPPKVQSALLEAMQEKQVTLSGKILKLPEPFFVMATQNPIETIGVYPLPEAQIDRFLFKLVVNYPKDKEEAIILNKNISLKKFEDYNLKPILSKSKIKQLQNTTKRVYLNEALEKYIVRLIDATRNPDKYKLKLGKYIEWGASPRAAIGLYIASKADALLHGRHFVVPQNIKNIAHDTLRHKIIINYEGQAENIKTDDIISEILSRIKVP